MGLLDNRWGQSMIALCLGLSLTFAFAPFHYSYITLLSLTAFLTLLRHTHFPKLIGFVYGLGWFGAGISWVHVSIAEFGGVPLFVSLLLMAFAGFAGFAKGFGCCRLNSRFSKDWLGDDRFKRLFPVKPVDDGKTEENGPLATCMVSLSTESGLSHMPYEKLEAKSKFHS
mgnify:CR=1 FL=1